jgi:hypothetical protein
VPLPLSRPKVDKGGSARTAPAPRQNAPAASVKPAAPSKPEVASLPAQPRVGRGGDALAYAKPDEPSSGGGLGQAFRNLFSSRPGSGAGASRGTAIYDISAATVYMPDGQRLEAHSGLGPWVDNPAYANKKNVGPTPPNTYILSMRESRFHGVEALRLTPADGNNKYGRNGLLAHTYMLRGRYAQSNGCVAFKDYERFLKAFKQGKVTRLVVVPGRSQSTRVASNGGGA